MAEDTAVAEGIPRTPKPEATKIEVQREANALTIYIPRMGLRGASASLLLFAALWNGFMAFFTIFTIGAGGLSDAPFVLSGFLALFWAIGIGIVVAAVRMMRLVTLVRIEGGELFIQKKLFGRGRLERYALGPGVSARLKVAYEQNDTPVHTVALKAAERDVSFGTPLRDAEKAWLVDEINGFLGVAPPLPAGRAAAFLPVEYRVEGERRRPQNVRSEVDIRPRGELRVLFPALRRTKIGRVAFALCVLLLLGWPAGAAWAVGRIVRARGDAGFPPYVPFLLFTAPFFVGAIFGLVKLLQRAELIIDRHEAHVRNTLRLAGAQKVRTVPVERIDQAVVRQVGPVNYPSLTLRDGVSVDIYAFVPVDELEWLVAETNEFLRDTRKM